MPAGKHGSSEITISYDDGPGGVLRAITAFVLQMGGVKITSNMQASTPFGAAIESMLPVGVQKIDQIELSGLWDDTATVGPHTVFLAPDNSPTASTRTLAIVFGNARTWTSEGYLVSYEVTGKNGNLTEFKAVLQQNSGAWS